MRKTLPRRCPVPLPLVETEHVLVGCRADCRWRGHDQVVERTVLFPVGVMTENGFVTRYVVREIHPACHLDEAGKDALCQRRQEIYERAARAVEQVARGRSLSTYLKKRGQVWQEIASEYTEGLCPAFAAKTASSGKGSDEQDQSH